MNSLQIELNTINEKLELLTYRKNQLEAVMGEYSDVINRVKSLIETMQDANVEPSNLLMEIESLIYCPEAEEAEATPKPELTPIESYLNELPSETPEPTPETDDDEDCAPDGLDDEDYGFDDEIEETPKAEQRGNSLLFQPNTYWDNGSSVRVIIPKKRRYRKELEAIVDDCIGQGLAEQFEINECGENWIIGLSPVTDELMVNTIIDNFYPTHTDGEAEETPETQSQRILQEIPVKLMALVPVATPAPTPKTQLNERAWRRGDTLLIGFSNKRLLNTWAKWFKDSWGDRVRIDSLDKLEGFDHCLSILWFGQADWERLSKLDYSLKPTEQNKQEQQPETPPKGQLVNQF